MANLNTNADIRDEGNWDYVGWSPRITSTGAMDTFVGLLATRANAILRQRVSLVWYNANVAVDPWATILKAAEMHLAQYYLLLAASQIAESSADTNPSPFLGDATTLLACADKRMAQFELCVDLTRTTARPGGRVPYVKGKATTGPEIERFDPQMGVDSDPYDGTYDNGAPANPVSG